MKKLLSFMFVCVLCLFLPISQTKTIFSYANTQPMVCIVIDDFGEDRSGVEEMLSLEIPLTVAVMPNLTHTKEDAEKAHLLGHEVILHMPFESGSKLPQSWYGPTYIGRYDSPNVAMTKLVNCLNSVPHAKGINFHMGSAPKQSQSIIDEIIKYTIKNNLSFLDSKTSMDSICSEVCQANNICFLERDIFLEQHGAKSMVYAQKMLQEAITLSKQKGFAIVIGHVGPEGGLSTANAIKNTLPIFKENNIKIVPLSTIYEVQQNKLIHANKNNNC